MENKTNENQYKPLELARKWLKDNNVPSTMHYKTYLKYLVNCFGSSTLPFIILSKIQQDGIITPNTSIKIMCKKNNCGIQFSDNMVGLIDSWLNFKECCPKCRDKLEKYILEQEKKALEEENKYLDQAPNVRIVSWDEPDVYIKYKTVQDEDGTYKMVPRTPEEIEFFKKEVEDAKRKIQEAISKDPSLIEKIYSKRKRLAENGIMSKELRRQEAYDKVNSRVVTGENTANNYNKVSIENTPTTLKDIIEANKYSNKDYNVLSDKNFDELDNIAITYGENISANQVWNNGSAFDIALRDIIDGNPYDSTLESKMNSDL